MPTALSFEQRFRDWLDASLAARIPKAVRAFTFCVSEGELCSCLELNGTSEFSRDGSEWAWSEIWQSPTGRLIIPNGGFSSTGESPLQTVERLVRQYLQSGILCDRLAAREGVALETLEGEYTLVYEAPHPSGQLATVREPSRNRRHRRTVPA